MHIRTINMCYCREMRTLCSFAVWSAQFLVHFITLFVSTFLFFCALLAISVALLLLFVFNVFVFLCQPQNIQQSYTQNWNWWYSVDKEDVQVKDIPMKVVIKNIWLPYEVCVHCVGNVCSKQASKQHDILDGWLVWHLLRAAYLRLYEILFMFRRSLFSPIRWCLHLAHHRRWITFYDILFASISNWSWFTCMCVSFRVLLLFLLLLLPLI